MRLLRPRQPLLGDGFDPAAATPAARAPRKGGGAVTASRDSGNGRPNPAATGGAGAGNSAQNPFRTIPALRDPEKPRVDVTPGDLLATPDPESVTDRRLYSFVVEECFARARDARVRFERDWRLSVEFEQGNQWVGWDAKARRFVDFVSADGDSRRFVTVNLIRPRLEAVASMVTQSQVESQPVPLTTSDLDRQAAAEARPVVAHYNRKFGARTQVREAVDWALKSTSVFLKTTFEPGELAEVPRYATNPATGERTLAGMDMAPVGDLCERLIPGFKVYLDPAANTYADCRWLIHAEVYPLSWFQERFENGYAVKADSLGGSVVSYFNAGGKSGGGIPSAYGIGIWSGTGEERVNKDVATCYEMWILPGRLAMFPRGAVIYCAGGQVLVPRGDGSDGSGGAAAAGASSAITDAWAAAQGVAPDDEAGRKAARRRVPGNYYPWPYACRTEFPFVELSWIDAPDSPYGGSLAQMLTDPQMDYNRTRTRLRERLEKDKPVWMVPKLAEVGAERWEDYGTHVKAAYNAAAGGPGQFFQPPPVYSQQWQILELIEKNMDDIAGTHDPNFRGEAPAGVTSGVAIGQLRQGDASRLSRFGARVERFVQQRDTWRLRHAAQFFSEERLMGLDDTGNPAQVGNRAGRSPGAPPAPPMPPAMAGMPPAGMTPPPGTPPDAPAGPSAPSGPADVDPAGNPWANAMAFKALTGGGQVRVLVTPGSALAETPDARNQRIVQFLQEGLFGPPNTPEAAAIAAELIEDNDSDIILERLKEVKARADAQFAAQNPPPPPPPPVPPDPLQMAQAQSQLRIQEQLALVEAQTRQKIALMEAERQMQQKYGPLVTLAGKLTPAGEQRAEEEAFGVAPLHEAAGHIAAAAALDANAGQAYGMQPPRPAPTPPGAESGGGQQ